MYVYIIYIWLRIFCSCLQGGPRHARDPDRFWAGGGQRPGPNGPARGKRALTRCGPGLPWARGGTRTSNADLGRAMPGTKPAPNWTITVPFGSPLGSPATLEKNICTKQSLTICKGAGQAIRS